MRRLTWVAFALSLLAGCASGGMKHAELKSRLPALGEDEGRVYFMRKSSMLGAAVQPDIYLDGKAVGQSKPGGFFYVDAKAGAHEASATTEAKRGISFSLDPGETKYIRSFPTFGVFVGRVNFELLNAAEGEKELAEESYIGEPPTAKPASDQQKPAAPDAS